LEVNHLATSLFEEHTDAIYQVSCPPQGGNYSVTLIEAERGRFIVKTGDSSGKIRELAKEAYVLSRLTSYRPAVPGFVARCEDAFLFTYIEGVNLAVVVEMEGVDPELAVFWSTEHGRFLREIHSWTPDLPCPESDWIDISIAKCVDVCQNGGNLSATADQFSLHAGKTFKQLLDFIGSNRSRIVSTIRFGHGDWCLPNALFFGGRVTGAVDWSNGGYADYRYDIATALWSLRRNGLAAYTSDFLNGYGFDGETEELDFFEAMYALI
jgi:aminoglycoside phosphotransferase